MANDDRSIRGTVQTSSEDSKYVVAMQLARQIAMNESTAQKDRAYWLNLYAECWHVVSYGQKKT